MGQLEKVHAFGWKVLDATLDQFAQAVNQNMPLEGDGIRIVDTNNGKLISVAQDTKGDAAGAPSTGGIVSQTQYPQLIPINEINWHGVKWEPIISVDPSTCAQSTITVLVQTNDDADFITIETPGLVGFVGAGGVTPNP